MKRWILALAIAALIGLPLLFVAVDDQRSSKAVEPRTGGSNSSAQHSSQPPATSAVAVSSVPLDSDRQTPQQSISVSSVEKWIGNGARRHALGRHAWLLARIDLPSDKLRRFKDLVAFQALSEVELKAILAEIHIPPNSPEAKLATQDLRAEAEAQIHALLSEEEYAQFAHLQNAEQIRSSASMQQLQGHLVDIGLPPLREGAVDRVAIEFSVALRQFSNDPDAMRVDPSTGLSKSQIWLTQKLAGYLDDGQLRALKDQFVEENAAAAALARKSLGR